LTIKSTSQNKFNTVVLMALLLSLLGVCSGCVSGPRGHARHHGGGITLQGIAVVIRDGICEAPQGPSLRLQGYDPNYNYQPYYRYTTFDGNNNPYVQYVYQINGGLVPVRSPVNADGSISQNNNASSTRIIGAWAGDQYPNGQVADPYPSENIIGGFSIGGRGNHGGGLGEQVAGRNVYRLGNAATGH
jgi:hypothetical protein